MIPAENKDVSEVTSINDAGIFIVMILFSKDFSYVRNMPYLFSLIKLLFSRNLDLIF